jgi:hypothetical protein
MGTFKKQMVFSKKMDIFRISGGLRRREGNRLTFPEKFVENPPAF